MTTCQSELTNASERADREALWSVVIRALWTVGGKGCRASGQGRFATVPVEL
jgi:hypothetical protein